MSERSDRYRRLAQTVTDKIRSVPEDRWASASPCPGWSARDLVRHLVQTQGLFAGFVDLAIEPGPDVDSDPLGAWMAASGQLQAFLDNPETADKAFKGFSGATTLGEAVDLFLCFDLDVHGWDLSRAAGLDDRIDPAELDRLWQSVEAFGDQIRSDGAFGPPVRVPPQASEQDKLLAHLGRDPRDGIDAE